MKKFFLTFATLLLVLTACTEQPKEEPTLSGLLKSNFQREIDGKKTDLYVLKNKNNMEVCITNFGGRIVSIVVPDKNGNNQDVVLGFDSVMDYKKYPQDFGATIGRYANRIGNAKFSIGDQTYQLPANNGPHCLHGGPNGFQYALMDAKQLNDQTLELTGFSKDGEEGFPGNLTYKVTFTLSDDNAQIGRAHV